MTSNEALKPCLRCGNSAFITGTDSYAVWCRTDNCLQMPPRASRDAAITAWNTRSTDTSVCASTEEVVERVARAISTEIDAIDDELENTVNEQTREEFRETASLRIARAALAASQAPETIERLREALERSRKYVAYLVRQDGKGAAAELLVEIDAALSSIPEPLKSHEQ